MRSCTTLQRLVAIQMRSCLPGAEAQDVRRCAAGVVRTVQTALQLRDFEIDGLMRGSLEPRAADVDPAVRKIVRAFGRAH
jgi:hypothetical protein